MLHLPEDVLIQILRYLDVRDLLDFAETIPKLAHLLWHPHLWGEVNLDRVFVIHDKLLELLRKNSLQVKSIAANSSTFFHTNKKEFSQVLTLMSNVTFLDLTSCNIMEEMDFLLHMPKLKHAVLDCLSILTTQSLIEYLPKCTSIETLSLKGIRFLTMGEITEICSQLVNLKCLDTQGSCDYIPDCVTQILTACPNLHTFLFNSIHFSRLYRAWVDLVNVQFPHVTFHYTTYQQVKRFERIMLR